MLRYFLGAAVSLCFVLRVLIGMSKQACAQLLGLNVHIVDECTCIAMQRLAGIA